MQLPPRLTRAAAGVFFGDWMPGRHENSRVSLYRKNGEVAVEFRGVPRSAG